MVAQTNKKAALGGAFHLPSPNDSHLFARLGHAGIGDVSVCGKDGGFLVIKVKIKPNNVTASQEA